MGSRFVEKKSHRIMGIEIEYGRIFRSFVCVGDTEQMNDCSLLHD